MKKISIKREQSQAGLSFAEREKFRPQVKNKLLLLLALLLTAATGAWATTPNSIVINGTPQVGDKSISLTYHFDPANVPNLEGYAPTLKVKCAADNKWDETLLSLTEVSSGTTNISLNTLGEFEAGKTYEVCFAYNNGNWVDEVFQSFVPAAAAPAGYTVSLKDGTEDGDNWTISPAEAAEGSPVTVTYSGEKKVKSVKAVKKAAAAPITLDNTITAWTAGSYAVPAGGLTYSDAITVSGDVTLTLTDGQTLTLNNGISLAEGATLTIQGNGTMNINGTDGNTSSTVGGNHGTLVLTSGTLTATGGNGGSVDVVQTDAHGGNGGVAINGSVIVSGGSLTARGGNGGSVDYQSANCSGGNGGDAISGSVTVSGGTLTATGGNGGSVGDNGSYCSGGNGGDAISGTLTKNGGSTSVNDGSNGSIGNMCDNCTAGTGGKGEASPAGPPSWKLTLSSPAKDLCIIANGGVIAQQTLDVASTEFTVEMPELTSQTVNIFATDGSGNCWYCTQENMSFAIGQTYQSSPTMTALDEDNSKPLYKITATSDVTIPDGKTVVLSGVSISGGSITCDGSVTMILMGANTVTATDNNAAIKIGGPGTTLTITGSGSLTAQGGLEAAGIGTDRNEDGELSFGNIVINGGTVTATGGNEGAGIGTGLAQGEFYTTSITCGDITINGGTVTAIGGLYGAGIGTGPTMSDGGSANITCGDITINGGTVTATAGDYGPGIGTGVFLKYGSESASNRCGNITIGAGVTSVTATKGGSYSPNSIGKGYASGGTQNYGTITIGGTVYATGVTASPFTYTPSN